MKKSLYFAIVATVLFAIGAGVYAWNYRSTFYHGNGANTPPARIRLGLPENSDVNGQRAPLGQDLNEMGFYRHSWKKGNLGDVEFVHGKYSFTIDNVVSVLGYAGEEAREGLYEWDITFGVSPELVDTDRSALYRMMSLFSELRIKGWVPYFDTDYPRLIGKQSWMYMTENSGYSLDPGYRPTVTEWKAAARRMPVWNFYADDVYLQVSLIKGNTTSSIRKTTYLFSIDVINAPVFYGLRYFGGDVEKSRNWNSLLPAELEKSRAKQLKIETGLKARGWTINKAYQIPPIKAVQSAPVDNALKARQKNPPAPQSGNPPSKPMGVNAIGLLDVLANAQTSRALLPTGLRLPGVDHRVDTESGVHIVKMGGEGEFLLHWDEFAAPAAPPAAE